MGQESGDGPRCRSELTPTSRKYEIWGAGYPAPHISVLRPVGPIREVFAWGRELFDDRLRLLPHVLLQVIRAAAAAPGRG